MPTISLQTLAATCVRGPTLDMPPVDRFGNATGVGYMHNSFAPKPSINSTYGSSCSIRGGSQLCYQAETLRQLDFPLKTCAYVIDLRCYVPIYFTEAARVALRPDVTIPRVLTLEAKNARGECHFHALFTRPIAAQKASKLAALGFTMEKADLKAFSVIEQKNAIWLYETVRHSNVELMRVPAQAMAQRLMRKSETPLKTRLERLHLAIREDNALREKFGRMPGNQISLNDLYRWVVAAIVLGYLHVDLRERIQPHLPIKLVTREMGKLQETRG